MRPRAGLGLLTLLSAFALAVDAPQPKAVTTDKLAMTGLGGEAPEGPKPGSPKTATTDTLAMTGLGGEAPAAAKSAPKTATTEKLTMTGAGK